ncbi:hypothetical protein ASQ66_gp20 [Aeropyrum pernix spindle-shaped virus 1]|nr:hypothetical protein ASQ66_gp20 [Aeropyrum pernix spindle-shaped virus 1]CCD22108.1 TPA: hypothetical protein [Aeropyrum pernix spindle-shaped virus 1]
MASATLPPPPDVLTGVGLDQLISSFASWWSGATFGLFGPVLAVLAVVTVFLKTRSASATAVVSLVLAAFLGREWLMLVAALSLAALLWQVWRASTD